MSVSGSRNIAEPLSLFLAPDFLSVSGARNSENGSAIFLGPETDFMVQFLAPETDVMGKRTFMTTLWKPGQSVIDMSAENHCEDGEGGEELDCSYLIRL